ncbi:MAG: thioredoxin [Tumebacillaceae bacterium]
MAIGHATKDNFAELTRKGTVLVDFWATWCGPCRMLLPVLEDLDREFGAQLSIVKVNVDDHGQLANQYEVMSIPTMVLFKNGKVVEKTVGYQSKQALAELIRPHL